MFVSPGPPDFEEELADCTAELGETVKLACRVTGTPKPIVSWYKGKPLDANPATGKSHQRESGWAGGQGSRVASDGGAGHKRQASCSGCLLLNQSQAGGCAQRDEVGQRRSLLPCAVCF